MDLNFRQVLEEMVQLEEMIYGITEFSDTTLDSTNKIIRDKKGRVVEFEDLCVTQQFQKADGSSFTKVSLHQS